MPAIEFKPMSLQEVRENLDYLVKLVAQGKRRIEMSDSTGERYVLMSKVELDSLESAINILSDSDSFKEVCSSLNHLAAATSASAMAQ